MAIKFFLNMKLLVGYLELGNLFGEGIFWMVFNRSDTMK